MVTHGVSRARGLALGLVAAVVGAVAPPLSAAGAASAPATCADLTILDQTDVEGLAPGTPLVGVTVEAGNTPSEIDFVVEYVQKSALQDGSPMVVARATSGSPVTDGKGIWFGMSGSPVYTVDGDGNRDALVGAVAFGLAWDGESTLAGLQPAYQMERVRGYPSGAAATTSVSLSATGSQTVAAATGLTAQAVRRFEPLAVPLTLSGASSRRLDLVQRAADHAGLRIAPLGGGSATSATAGAPATVAAGDNFAAVLSYGHLTAAGIGTTTYTCGNYAMAFGHPFLFSGRQAIGGNAATRAYVVKDRLGGSYKLAEVGGLAGRVDQDRAAGIRTRLGGDVPLIPMVSKVAAPDTGESGRARTDIVQSREAPFLGWMHTVVHLDDIADHWSDGSATLRWTINGVTRNGVPWQLQRGNRYTSPFDITFESGFELFEDLETLQNNPFRQVRFTSIHVGASVLENVVDYKVKRVRVWRRGAYRRVRDVLRVDRGERLKLEVLLGTGAANRVVYREITVPRRARGFGNLNVSGRGDNWDAGEGEEFLVECMFDDCDDGPAQPRTFSELLTALEDTPRNDVLTTRLLFVSFDEETGAESLISRANRARLDRVVVGSVSFHVRVRRSR